MNKTRIPISDTGLFSKLICDFIEGNTNLQMYVDEFVSLESITNKINKKKIINREILVSTLNNQYKNTNFYNNDISIVKNNISSILDNKTYTITTGHQLNIFVSPLFLIYKIISIISYVEYLNKQFPDYHFVPCFWMATDDHDFDEINSCTISDKKYTWSLKTNDAIGNLESKTLLPVLKSMKNIFLTNSHGLELYDRYLFAYQNNNNYADATRSILTALFYDYGLVIVDGNCKELKTTFSTHFKDEITNSFTHHMVKKTYNSLRKSYKPQINPMESNLFYLSDSIRSKIKVDKQKYYSDLHNLHWSKNELLNKIDNCPQKFSPNVFLRTLYQESIMPNILYIGGPSEISYWLQLKNMFKHQGVDFPLLALRSHFLILSRKAIRLKSKLGLDFTDLFLDYENKLKKTISCLDSFQTAHQFENLNNQLLKMEQDFKQINSFPINDFYVFKKRFIKEISRLESKILKLNKIKNNTILSQTEKINNEVFIDKNIQEKSSSFIPYYIKYGKSFFNLLIKESSIIDNKYVILTEEDEINHSQ
ncbi:MAG: bacillithiol biosynthesis cysteine-adding enzyme BshC [Flavobacteriales bacterium]|nr:bacillithiol biosynthesis cysteine-adding enzyme BshC [Flavobacteriales bacterium]